MTITAPEHDKDADRDAKASADAALWRRFAGAAGDEVKADPAHRIRLAGIRTDGFGLHLRPVRSPDQMRGQALMADCWRIGHERLQLSDGNPPWSVPAPSRHYADRLHRFDWIGDLFAQGEAGSDRGRLMVDNWAEEYGTFDGFYWRLTPLTARVWNWMKLGPALFEHGPEEARDLRLRVLMRQIRQIEAHLEDTDEPAARWRGHCILVAAALTLYGGKLLEERLIAFDSECTAQLLPDGGHVTRSPQKLLECLADMLVLKDVIERAGRPVPDFVQKWVPRMGAMLNFFTLPDGGLAPFNDGGETRPDAVKDVLQALGEAPRRFSFAMKSGFQKLQKKQLCLVLDAGSAPPMPYAGRAHSGPLGFVLSDGAARLVTSCGFSPEVNLDWQAAVRRTGAHSTLSLAGRDANRFETYEATRLLCPIGPEGISAKRLEEADEIWLDAQHGGWKTKYGLIHRRRLFMSGDGARLTGEDAIVRPVSLAQDEEGKFISFDIRFHLHPSVKAVTAGDAIQIECETGAIWRFRTTHPGTRLELSRYLGRGLVEPTQQIVMSGRADPNGDGSQPPNCIRWGFRREKAAI